MRKIEILCIGKNKAGDLNFEIIEYYKRLRKYFKIEISYLPSVILRKTKNIELVKEQESKQLFDYLKKGEYVILLDEKGKTMDSHEFANLLYSDKLNKKIVFVVGGVYGVSAKFRMSVDMVLSFSKFTFTHQHIRLLLLEQLFRAGTIHDNKTYHY